MGNSQKTFTNIVAVIVTSLVLGTFIYACIA